MVEENYGIVTEDQTYELKCRRNSSGELEFYAIDEYGEECLIDRIVAQTKEAVHVNRTGSNEEVRYREGNAA